MHRLILGSGALGLVIGFVAGLFVGSARSAGPAAVPEPAAPRAALPKIRAPAPPQPPITQISASRDSRQLELEVELLRAQLASLGGLPTPWPDDIAEALTADRVDDWLSETFGDSDELHLGELDCDEYPCLAHIEYGPGLPGSTAVVMPMIEEFTKAHPDGDISPSLACMPEGCSVVLAFFSAEDSPMDHRQRLSIREQSLRERAE